jgi:PAS domain
METAPLRRRRGVLLISDPSMLNSPRLREAYAYWNAKRRNKLMPSRSDIDPVEIPPLLPYVFLIDVVREPLDFRYQLIGTQACDIMRGDFTGQFFSKIPGKGKGTALWQGCDAVLSSKAAMSWDIPYVGPERFLRSYKNVLLPLSNDGVNVTMIFKVISFERGPTPA